MFKLIIDSGITIRTLHPDDTEELFSLLEQNRSRLRPWVDPSALPETVQAARKFAIECYFGSLDPLIAIDTPYIAEMMPYFPAMNPPMEMGIWLNGNLAGEITLTRLPDSETTAEFGYWIAADKEGSGVITRCVAALMHYAIDNMGIERFIIGCAVENQRSRAIPERLGYQLQATIPNGEVVGQSVYDRVIYGIEATAWREHSHPTTKQQI